VGRRASLVDQTMAAMMFSVAAGSGLRGRRTLKEGRPNVVIWCTYMVGSWLVRDSCVDRFDEEEDRDEKEEDSGVVIRCLGEQEQGDCENGGKEGDCLPCANSGSAYHRWIECIAQARGYGECR
jgi:hypothetical protein